MESPKIIQIIEMGKTELNKGDLMGLDSQGAVWYLNGRGVWELYVDSLKAQLPEDKSGCKCQLDVKVCSDCDDMSCNGRDKEEVCDFTKTYVPSDRDYVEDFKDDDNGKYFYTCLKCKMNYLAHKNRRPIICKKCTGDAEAVYGGVTICPKCHSTCFRGVCPKCDKAEVCEDCGITEDVTVGIPFEVDVNGFETKVTLCASCHEARVYNILKGMMR